MDEYEVTDVDCMSDEEFSARQQARFEATMTMWQPALRAKLAQLKTQEDLIGWVVEGLGLARDNWVVCQMDRQSAGDGHLHDHEIRHAEMEHIALAFLWLMERVGFEIEPESGFLSDAEVQGIIQ